MPANSFVLYVYKYKRETHDELAKELAKQVSVGQAYPQFFHLASVIAQAKAGQLTYSRPGGTDLVLSWTRLPDGATEVSWTPVAPPKTEADSHA